MESEKYTIGIDFGSDSVRALVVSAIDGKEIAGAVDNYRLWQRGEYCNPQANQYRQHPQDYIDSLERVVRATINKCTAEVVDNIGGLSFDTTASTPAITDRNGTPLALLDDFADDPDAMFVLWKDHTAIAEADEINALAHSWTPDYTKYSGGTYSCEWAWSKVLHILRRNPAVREKAYSWVEHCDWMSGILTGNTTPATIARSRCVAGHKVMWNSEWGGLPSHEFAEQLDSKLASMRDTFNPETYTADHCAGALTAEWAERLGLPAGIAIGVGAIDCHIGAVGAGISDNVLVKVMGTSTCDIITSPYEALGDRPVRGICGQVDGSVIPLHIGFEAGQSAFGDVYAWFKRLLAWPLKTLTDRSDAEEGIIAALTREAEQLPLAENNLVACDWFNGRRTPDADPSQRGAIYDLTLSTTAPEIFKALVEATAFGSRAINERMTDEGVKIDGIIAVGGISKKSRFVMQTMADVIGVSIKVAASEQTCALGAAMYAAVAAGIHPTIEEAQRAMSSGYDAVYMPNRDRHEIYNKLYARYLKNNK